MQSYRGQSSGRLPNIHWRALDLEELRAMPRYQALPPAPTIDLGSPCSYRFLRQEHPTWAAAHRGVLTTGMLKEALGFYEPDTVQQLGMPRHYGSQGAVQQVYNNLLDSAPHTKAVSKQHATRCRAANLALVADYNARMTSAAQQLDDGDTTTQKQRFRALSLGCQGLGCGPHTACMRAHPSCLFTHSAVRCAWGKAQEASSLSVLLSLYPDCVLHEVGLCLVDPTELSLRYGFSLGYLPPLGASPDALLQRPVNGAVNGLTNGSLTNGSTSSSIQKPPVGSPRSALVDLLEEMDHLDLNKPSQPRSTAPALAASDAADIVQGAMEVVEVKNTCPFGTPRKQFSCGKYGIFDQGPRKELPPMWVPQLQMEMLAAQADTALLVTRSATKGVTIFRMQRDDAYIKAMLGVLAFLNKAYVVPRRPPGSRPYSGYPQYAQFIHHTKRVAESAVVVMRDAEAHRFAPARNMRLLLDDAPCID